MIAPLTSAIDPDSDTMLGLNVLMFMLSFGLAFLTVGILSLAKSEIYLHGYLGADRRCGSASGVMDKSAEAFCSDICNQPATSASHCANDMANWWCSLSHGTDLGAEQ